MQTFLPYSDFYKCVIVLDKKRAWKQVIETKQILCILRAEGLPDDWVESKSYTNQPFKNHPACLMWVGYEELLKHYYNVFLEYCKRVHRINTDLRYLNCELSGFCVINNEQIYIDNTTTSLKLPFWYGNINFHRSHRSRLIEKDKKFYNHKFEGDEGFNEGRYLWPVSETQTYKLI